jgi:hypothetical protein
MLQLGLAWHGRRGSRHDQLRRRPEVRDSIVAAAERLYGAAQEAIPAAQVVTGRYLLREDYPVTIEDNGAALTLTVPGQAPVDLLPLPGDRYQVAGLDCEITFDPADGAPATHIHQDGSSLTAPLVP